MSVGELPFAALLLRALRARPGDLSEEELRDGLWLALQMVGMEEAARKEPSSELRTERTAESRLPEARPEARAEERRESRSPPTQANPGRTSADATLEAPSWGKEGGGLLFRTPGASALPGALALARALRPLRRRVASQRRFEVDEEATARRISEARAWGAEWSSIRGQVVVRPVKERWFELAVVVDGAASMAIWERTVRELVRLLAHLGAFRDVRVWTLDSEGPRLQLHVGITRRRDRPRSVREVGDPTGRRVIVVLTDGVAEAWREGRALAALQEWSAQTPVGLVSVLPEELWHGTAMRALPGLTVRALRSGETRVRLEKLAGRRIRSGDPERFAELRPIPVASLEPASIARLAGMLTGTGSGSAVLPGLVEEVRPAGEAGPELPGDERVRRFDRLVSPEARRLARLFAVTPLFLPVMRLVQHTMLPRSNQGHLAEVFLGGLLEEVAGTSTEVDTIEYAFRPGVMEVLRQTVEDLADTMAVLRTVSRFVAERIGQPLDFGAALLDPTAKFPAKLAKDRIGRAFARVSAEVLRPLGGEYAALAERLESVGGTEARSSLPVPVMNANAPFRGQVVLVAGSSRRLTDAQRWAAVVVGRGLAQRGFGVASSHFEGVDRMVVEALVTTVGKTPAEQARVRRERVRDFVPADVCAAIVVGGAEGTWSRVELARYLGIPVLGFAGTGGAAARVAREIDPDVQEASISSEAQAEAVAERLFAELALRVADSGSMPPWVGVEHLAALRAYALSTSPDPRVLEAVEDAIEAGKSRPSLEDLRAGLQDVRPEVRTVIYLCEARVPHVEVIEALANAVVGEVRAGVVMMCSGVFRLGLAALDVHCEQVTMLAEIDVLTKASRSILGVIGTDEYKGWVDGNVHVRAARLQGRARASPTLWVTIQAQTYERIRLEAASDERTGQLDAWAEQVLALAQDDRGVRTKTLERQFQTGQDGRRALALACATGGTRAASVGMLYDGIKSSRSGFEQWLALNAALHWLQSAADVDGVVGAILEQVLDDGSRLNPRSKSDRAGIATALLGMYGVRRGHGPGAQSASVLHRWLGEIRDKIGDDTGARASFEAAIQLATELAEEVHARVGLGLLEARSGDSERAVSELLLVLERTDQIRDAEIGGARLKALVSYSSLCDAANFRRWIAAAARWELPNVMPENLGTLHEWGEQLLLLGEELRADRPAQRSCYEQALALAEFLIGSPDYEHGEGERELAEKARQSLAGLGDRQAELAQAQADAEQEADRQAELAQAQAQADHDAEQAADRHVELAQAQADHDAEQEADHQAELAHGWQLLAQPDAEGARAIFAEILNRTGSQKPVAAMLGMAVFHGLRTQTPSAAQWNTYMETARIEADRQHASIELRRAIALWYGLFSQFAGQSDACASALAFLRLNPGPASPFTLPIPHVISNLMRLMRSRGPSTSRGSRPIQGRNINGDDRSRVSGLRMYSRLAAAMDAGSPLTDNDPLWTGIENNDGSAVWLTDEQNAMETIRIQTDQARKEYVSAVHELYTEIASLAARKGLKWTRGDDMQMEDAETQGRFRTPGIFTLHGPLGILTLQPDTFVRTLLPAGGFGGLKAIFNGRSADICYHLESGRLIYPDSSIADALEIVSQVSQLSERGVADEIRRYNIIDADQWNEAKWRGVGYFFGGGKPPGIVVAMENLISGQKLFRGLIARIGRDDPKDLLRVAFVEGDILGEDPGYTVVVGTDMDHMLSDLLSEGQIQSHIAGFLSRPLRCNLSPRLALFRKEFEKYGQCFIAPGDMSGQPRMEEGLLIKNVVFRQTKDITSTQDPDYLVFTLNR
jgi:hypothetical protein